MRVAFGQMLVPFDAHHAAHQVDHQIRVAALVREQGGQVTVGFVLSALTHHASIQHDHISLAGF